MRRAVVTVPAGLFLALMGVAHFDPDDFGYIDRLASAAVLPFQNGPWVEAFVVLTTLGSTSGVILIALLAAFLLRRERILVLRMFIALVGTSITVEAVKRIIERARPETLAWLGPLHSYSFPSGHAASAMALFGFLTVVAYGKLKGLRRLIAMLVAGLLIVGIGMSRIVLAAHYVSDVLAGYLLGAFWIAFAFVLLHRQP